MTARTARLTLRLDSHDGIEYDCQVWEEEKIGIGHDFYWFPKSVEEEAGYSFVAEDRLAFSWVNPNANEIGFGMRVGFAPVT